MNKLLINNFFLILSFVVFIFFGSISYLYAQTSKYFCVGESNHFYFSINEESQKITIGNKKSQKYWTGNPDLTFWHTASGYSVHEYTFDKSFNKLSGKLEIKSHNLITSADKWHYYKCSISE